MITLLNYNLNSDYEDNKETLEQLDNYLALTDDNQMVHLKPLNIFYVTTNNSGTTINKRTADGDETVPLEKWENKLTDWNYGFYFDGIMEQDQITSFDFSKYDTSKVTTMSNMFYWCRNLTSLDVSNFDTSMVTNMSSMFNWCTNLTSLNLINFNTTNVTRMDLMFQNCSGLTSLDVSSFNTSLVDYMFRMFYYCKSLTSLDVSNFDTSKVTDMSAMFSGCTNLTSLDLSNFDTSKVTSMNSMFNECSSLTSLDVSNFDTSNVNLSGMFNMFSGCNKLTHIKCKQSFKDWCITNQTTIKLPTAMVNGTVGDNSTYNWEIIDFQG